jgi:hypothetical protein
MSESDPTGYRESPDTSDGPVADDQIDGPVEAGAPGAEGGPTLTTDEDAQDDDGLIRPGNVPD